MRIRLLSPNNTGRMRLFQAICIFACINEIIAAPNKNTASDYKIGDLSEDSSLIGRIINGIALSQGLNDGSVDVKEVVSELFNLKPGTTLDALESENVVGLADDLNQISSVVDTECGAKKCDELDVVAKGITALESLESFTPLDYVNALKDGSIQVLGHLKKAYGEVKDLKDRITRLTTNLKNVAAGTVTDIQKKREHVFFITSDLGVIANSSQTFAKKFSPEQVDALEENKLKAAIGSILTLNSIPSAFVSQQTSISWLNTKLEVMKKVTETIKASLSDDVLRKIENKKQLLIDLNGDTKLFLDNKKTTHGFFDGANDFIKLSTDIDSTFFKDMVTSGTSEELRQNHLLSALALSKQIEPLQKVLINSKTPNLIENIRESSQVLKSARNEVENLNVFQPFQNCVLKLNGLKEIMDKWVKEEKNLVEMASVAKDFVNQFNAVIIKVDKLDTLLKALPENKELETIKAYADINDVNAEITGLESEMAKIDTDALSKWSKAAETDMLIVETDNWLKDNDFNSILQCFQNKENFSKAKAVLENRVSLDALLKLKTGNNNLVEVSNAAKAQQATINSWNEFKKTQKTRTIRAAVADVKLENPFKVTRDMSGGVKVFRDLAAVSISKDDFKKFLDADKSIDDGIKMLPDGDPMKAQLAMLWNDKTKETLENLPLLVDEFNKKITTKPKDLLQFSKFFNTSLKFDGVSDLNLQLLSDDLLSIGLILPDAELLKRQRKMADLHFAHAMKNLAVGSSAFALITTYFAAFHKSNQSQAATQRSTSPYQRRRTTIGPSTKWILPVSIGTGILLLMIGGTIVALLFCDNKATRWIKVNGKRYLCCKKEPGSNRNSNRNVPPDPNRNDLVKVKPGDNVIINIDVDKKPIVVKVGDEIYVRQKNEKPSTASTRLPPNPDEDETQAPEEEKQVEEIVKMRDLKKEEQDEAMESNKRLEAQKAFCALFCKNPPNESRVNFEFNYFSPEFFMNLKNNLISWTRPKGYPTKHTVHRVSVKDYLCGKNLDTFVSFSGIHTERTKEEMSTAHDLSSKRSRRVERTQEASSKTAEELNDVSSKITKAAMANYDKNKTETTAEEPDNRSSAAGEDVESGLESSRCDQYADYESESDEDFPESDDCPWGEVLDKEVLDNEIVGKINIGRILTTAFGRFRAGGDPNPYQRFFKHPKEYIKENKRYKKRVAACERAKRAYQEATQHLPKINGKPIIDHKALQIEFFGNPIRDPDNKLNIYNLASGYMCEKMIEVSHWPHKKDNEWMNHPLSAKDIMEIIKIATKDIKKDAAAIVVDIQEIAGVGDLHGSLKELVQHLNLQLRNNEARYIFTGDYVDRGARSIDVVILLMCLKIVCPEKFLLLRGNHELAFINIAYGFFEECIRTFGEEDGHMLWVAVNEMFGEMPIVANANGSLWFSHGGITRHMPKGLDASLKLIKKKPESLLEFEMFWDSLWSDPCHTWLLRGQKLWVKPPLKTRTELQRNPTIGGIVLALEKCNLDMVFRGHEVPQNGFTVTAGDRFATMYGATCNEDNNYASQVNIRNCEMTYVRMINMDEEERREKQENDNLKTVAEEEGDSNESAVKKERRYRRRPTNDIKAKAKTYSNSKTSSTSKASSITKGSTTTKSTAESNNARGAPKKK